MRLKLSPEKSSWSLNRAIPEKNEKGGSWGHGISRGIEERKCGNSRDQLKKKWNFQGCLRKNSWNFHRSWFWILEFSRGVTQFCWISSTISHHPANCLKGKQRKGQHHWKNLIRIISSWKHVHFSKNPFF